MKPVTSSVFSLSIETQCWIHALPRMNTMISRSRTLKEYLFDTINFQVGRTDLAMSAWMCRLYVSRSMDMLKVILAWRSRVLAPFRHFLSAVLCKDSGHLPRWRMPFSCRCRASTTWQFMLPSACCVKVFFPAKHNKNVAFRKFKSVRFISLEDWEDINCNCSNWYCCVWAECAGQVSSGIKVLFLHLREASKSFHIFWNAHIGFVVSAFIGHTATTEFWSG